MGTDIRLPRWPGPGWPGQQPATPQPGAHAEVQLTGTKGRTGTGPIGLVRKKNQAFVLITVPGQAPISRTLKGNFTIRLAMEWCAAFNQLSGTA